MDLGKFGLGKKEDFEGVLYGFIMGNGEGLLRLWVKIL